MLLMAAVFNLFEIQRVFEETKRYEICESMISDHLEYESEITSGCSSRWCLRMNRSDSGQLAGRPRRNERFRLVSIVYQVSLVQCRKPDVVDLRLRKLLQRLLYLLLLKLILNQEVMLSHHCGVHVAVLGAGAVVVVVSACQRRRGDSDALIGRGRVVDVKDGRLLLLLNDAHHWNS